MDITPEGGARFAENPLENARLCIEIANDSCCDCGDFHLRSVLRRIAVAPDSKIGDMHEFRAMIMLALARQQRSTRPIRVAIVGSTDTGILATLLQSAHAVGGDPMVAQLAVTLIDQCATPLALCKAYAHNCDVELEVVQADIQRFSCAAKFDLVLMHGVLPFFPSAQQHDYMTHIISWLSADATLISSTHLGRDPDRTTHARRTELAIANLQEFADAGLGIDAKTVASLTKRLKDSPHGRENERSVFAGLDDATEFYQSAGLALQSAWVVHHHAADTAKFNRKYKQRCIVMGTRAQT